MRICLLQLWSPEPNSPNSAFNWTGLFAPHQFVLTPFHINHAFLTHVQTQGETLDCLIFLAAAHHLKELHRLAWRLCECGLLLPTVLIVVTDAISPDQEKVLQALHSHERFFYHNASLVKQVPSSLMRQVMDPSDPSSQHKALQTLNVSAQIDQAIALFLQLSPTCGIPQGDTGDTDLRSISERVHLQQQRLAEKLRERLGYKGVYYHRDPNRFYRRLPEDEQRSMMQRLRGLYQAIVLDYFQSTQAVNARIDEFVALAFFGDIGASQVLELHMGLMDDFAKQLKLEGRNEDILLDYRITLIDVIAHLSEMYRRSIPREA